MARKLSAAEIQEQARPTPSRTEIPVYAAWAGAGDRDAPALRRALQLPVSPRVWHRVFPYLPRERRDDGSMLLWHPDASGWQLALDSVHARVAPSWRKSGAYLIVPGSDQSVLHDFHDFDEVDLADWSIAVPDAHYRALCGHLRGESCRLSEIVARWAAEVGPQQAGAALAIRGAIRPATTH